MSKAEDIKEAKAEARAEAKAEKAEAKTIKDNAAANKSSMDYLAERSKKAQENLKK